MPRKAKLWLGLLGLILMAAASGAGLFWAWPRLFPSLVSRGTAAYDRGDWSEAATLANARLKSAPTDPDALRLLARTSVRQRNDQSARAIYSRLGGLSGLKPEDFYLLGVAMNRAGDRDTARECWATGLLADPNHPELLREFALMSIEKQQFERAAGLAKKLTAQPGWEVRGHLLYGQIEYQLDNLGAAIASFQTALDSQSKLDNSDATEKYPKLLARALLQVGKPAEAATQLKKVLESGPDPEAYWLLSRSALQAGAIPEMLTALRQSGTYADQNLLAPEPSPYVGAAACVSCHGAIAKAQQNSLHARTFVRGPTCTDLPLPAQAVVDPKDAKVSHTLACAAGKIRFTTTQDKRIEAGLVEYLFGSGNHGKTLVGRDDKGREREFRLSYYADGPVWDVTTGHPAQPPAEEGFLGRLLSPDDSRSCFYCHTTVARSAREQTGPESRDRAIGCERCHGPGGNHLKAVEAKLADLAIARPRLAHAPQVVALCAQCHSPLGRDVSPNDPLAARFPSTSLTWSRCFTESGGKLDCRTCHNPHRSSEISPGAYEAKCLACHSPTAKDIPRKTVCPVNARADCLKCHMPAVKIGVPHATFTDHYIRVRPTVPPGTASGPKG